MACRRPVEEDPMIRARAVTVGAVLVALVAAGCGSGAGSQAAASASKRPVPETFTGPLDAFYRVPAHLRRGAPGQLIRVQDLGVAAGAHTYRVMYHSRDVRHHDRAVTGIVTVPTGPAPERGWPVVSWAHGTTGLASPCAPSRSGTPAPAFGVRAVAVATDYIGLGPIGERHPYLSGPDEAHSVIDAVRAARALPGSHAGTRWLAIGHSQGGHSALFTNQLAASYAPELHLLGTVSLAPAAELARTFGPADQIVPRIVGVMALYGLAADHPQIKPRDYVGAEVAARDSVIETGCLDQITAAFVPIPADTFYKVFPLDKEPARSVILANDPGHVRGPSPLLVVEGTADTFVVPARVDALMQDLCKVGQVTQRLDLPGADHGTEVATATPQITKWFTDRLASTPPVNDCTK
jgi:hypothetical protein